MSAAPRVDPLVRRLLKWYERHRRDLPWRTAPGTPAEAYRVWLSEIMLQQTTVATVQPYFRDFVARWPRVEDLAAASLDDVLHAWQGLGYYARARNLHRCARELSGRLEGLWPESEAELEALPGIGPYTAAAIAAIAFGLSAVVVDGNVERVMARLHGVDEPLPGAKARLRELAARLTPARRAGDYAQALMDLGATVCTPRAPACGRCPWSEACVARARGRPERLPRRAPKAARPLRRGVAFWALRPGGEVLVRRRPERGLLGGMIEVPSSPWREQEWGPAEAGAEAPFAAEWRRLEGIVGHTFTHFRLELAVLAGVAQLGIRADGAFWHPLDRLDELALSTLTRKVVRHARSAGARSGAGILAASIG